MNHPHVTVDAYAGYKGEETPRSFAFEGVSHRVTEIVDRWYTDSCSYFRVDADDGQRYVLRYHLDEGQWELVMQDRA
ncbi:MAG: hypothetical protein GDA67_10160 [Nitrospira sp. CR1.3]|nr:hypothetical protein [Nitrospira sp. CR1.3]